jgi:hypothetical protein
LQSLSVHTSGKDSAAKKKAAGGCAAAKVFARYDVIETSYHLYSDRIDLHLCDDPGGKGRSCHPRLSEGGAFQVPLLPKVTDIDLQIFVAIVVFVQISK